LPTSQLRIDDSRKHHGYPSVVFAATKPSLKEALLLALPLFCRFLDSLRRIGLLAFAFLFPVFAVLIYSPVVLFILRVFSLTILVLPFLDTLGFLFCCLLKLWSIAVLSLALSVAPRRCYPRC